MGVGGPIPYISAGMIAPVPDVIGDHGGTVDRPFREAGVPTELASEPEQILPLRNYLVLLEAAAREIGDDHIGVSIAQRLKIEDLGDFGKLVIGAPTLRGAIEVFCTQVQSLSPASRCWLDSEGETVRWHYELTGIPQFREGLRLKGEQFVSLFLTVIRLATSSNWRSCEILLQRSTPLQLHSVQTRLGTEARCVGAYAVTFRRNLLDLPMTCGKQLGAAEQPALVHRLMSSAPEQTFIGSVKAIIRGHLCGGYPEMSAVAYSTELRPRTFQRRLAEEGFTYSDLVTVVRCEVAKEMLMDPSRSQLDISLSVGYSDAANFSRAFRQWTGVTPSEFRHSSLRLAAAT